MKTQRSIRRFLDAVPIPPDPTPAGYAYQSLLLTAVLILVCLAILFPVAS